MTRYTPNWLQQGSYAGSQDRRVLGAIWPTAASVGAAATVTAGTMQVQVPAGAVAVPTQNNTGTTLCVWDAAEFVTHAAAPPSGQTRIDVITCHPRGNDLDAGSNNDFIIDIIQGTPATTGSQAVPAVPAGQVALYQVTVPGGAAALVAGNLTDVRPGGLNMPPPSGVGSAPRGFIASAVGPASTVTVGINTTIMTLTANVLAGRRYRLYAYARGQQITANATVTFFSASVVDLANFRFFETGVGNIAASAGFYGGSGSALVTPSTSASRTFTLLGYTNAGAMTVSANNCELALEDIGSQ